MLMPFQFDVGDRVSVYGNTGASMQGDDYFVKEISLLYTEFKKMEGHLVQAPNSYLNQLFILNQRRSGKILCKSRTLNILTLLKAAWRRPYRLQ